MIDKYNEAGIPTDALERTSQGKAKPIEECIYPRCDECDKYHGHYCTVPMVVSKQIYLIFAEKMHKMDEQLNWIEKCVTAQILGAQEPDAELTRCDEVNITWDEYLK